MISPYAWLGPILTPPYVNVALALAVWRVSIGGGSTVYESHGLLVV